VPNFNTRNKFELQIERCSSCEHNAIGRVVVGEGDCIAAITCGKGYQRCRW
jgi:hypothetical protein